jgi:hypothetical protein
MFYLTRGGGAGLAGHGGWGPCVLRRESRGAQAGRPDPEARGLTNPEIAAQLFLSNHTIKTHISRIFAKTGSRDRAAAIGYAHRHNIG